MTLGPGGIVRIVVVELLAIFFSKNKPGANVIKLFTDVSYELS